MEKKIFRFFYNKKGLELAKTLLVIILVIIGIIILYYAVSNAAEKIFG